MDVPGGGIKPDVEADSTGRSFLGRPEALDDLDLGGFGVGPYRRPLYFRQ